MNYGRYFKLNISASRFDEGVSVFDYIDLPAYFDPNQSMSPRYPISVILASSEVKFLLHYCVYKSQRDNNAVGFSYKMDAYSCKDNQTKIGIRHIEEIVLELPLSKDDPEALSSVVKQMYSTIFPIALNENRNSNYIVECLHKRYEAEEDNKYKNQIEKNIYNSYRKQDISEDNVSYSSLYIWGLKDTNDELFQLRQTVGNKTVYDKFLRKLLLDFMFDFIHSDVFQNSDQYNNVKSSLMSDFFFSAIIHKSEYYYYRALVNLRLKKECKNTVYKIYAEYLDKAEKRWIETIQSSLADRHFDFTPDWYESDAGDLGMKFKNTWNKIKKSIQNLCFSNVFIIGESWFVNPEIELHRVLFKLKIPKQQQQQDKNELISNSKHLADLLDKVNQKDLRIRDTQSSKWLFKRYNFSDAMRLHFFRYFNLFFTCILLLFIIKILSNPSFLMQKNWEEWWLIIRKTLPITTSVITSISAICIIKLLILHLKPRYVLLESSNIKKIILRHRVEQIVKVTLLTSMVIFIFLTNQVWLQWLLAIFILFIFIGNISRCIHLAFPRLISSIAAAWLTIALSEDLYKAFFDSQWTIIPCALISLTVLIFILYEINKVLPYVNLAKKFCRALELMLISYSISLFVGFWVINFTGEKFLERSTYLPDYYKDYILKEYNDQDKPDLNWAMISSDTNMNKYTSKMDSIDALIGIYASRHSQLEAKYINEINILTADSLPENLLQIQLNSFKAKCIKQMKEHFLLSHGNSRMFLDLLRYVYHRDSDNNEQRFISTIWTFNKADSKSYEFFILRDFLIQFSFIAMFIGIFIQLIFEEKNITES